MITDEDIDYKYFCARAGYTINSPIPIIQLLFDFPVTPLLRTTE